MMRLVVVIALLIFLLSPLAYASTEFGDKTIEQVCEAIYHAEGGKAAKWPYGVRYADRRTLTKDGAKQACETIVMQRAISWMSDSAATADFIRYVGYRYCPEGGKLDDGRCRHWVENVKWFLRNPRR